ncbi:S49 family peptidase [Sulfitobacter sp. D35]|uniref:S49 family peptidase n=1 Tax=Sulfitobacter sp. D35 TaxID=3083252 RepID=UPI00296E7AB3|nr:S49 family peptidase [Sulfitobacter sp. D35]MDW4500383.1 S49 family peptidase [Sulfitobacter sp. D35]
MKRWIPFLKSDPVVAIVRMSGMISASGRGTLNDDTLGPVLEKAFSRGKPAAVALQINSPGGSPVQSSLIGARIRRLAAEKEIPVYAFVEDVAASGGYWLAAAADEIYADESSVLGSIGVISATFGVHQFIERHGVERRVYTAGKSKSMLDPFRPENPEDVARLKTLLDGIHDSFKAHVARRREGKIVKDRDLFTGEIWLAEQATELGLIDGVGHLRPMMKERFGDKVSFRRYGVKRPWLSRFGAQVFGHLADDIEERAAFARFGL